MKDLFEEEAYYHIYNHANGDENLFREDTNYRYFLEKYFFYIEPVAETFAFCLLKNHFHILIRVRSLSQAAFNKKPSTDTNQINLVSKQVSHQFSRMFNSYAKAYNKMYNRRGSLFQTNIKRKRIQQTGYLQTLIMYIHNNPVKDGFTRSIYDWPYSSWHFYAKNKSLPWQNEIRNKINCNEAIEWFGDKDNFLAMHKDFDYQNTNSVFDIRNFGALT